MTTELRPGTVFAGAWTVKRQLGQSPAWERWGVVHPSYGACELFRFDPSVVGAYHAHGDLFDALGALNNPSVQRLLERGQDWVALSFHKGETLDRWLARREGGTAPTFREAHDLLGYLCVALEALHTAGAHGALTLQNVLVDQQGAVLVLQPGVARLTLEASAHDLVGLAPEVLGDPWAASEASDIYGLGVMAVAMLSNAAPTANTFSMLVEELASHYPAQVVAWVQACLSEEPIMRPGSVAEVRRALRESLVVMRAAGLSGEVVGPGAQPHQSADAAAAPASATAAIDALLADLDVAVAVNDSAQTGARWLVRKQGRDFGPFDRAHVLRMLHSDEIDEHTEVVDSWTQAAAPIVDVHEFSDAVIDYLPQRAKRRLQSAERREHIVTEVKRTGRTTAIVGTLAAIVLAASAWALRAEATPVPLASLVGSFDFVVDAPQPDYQAVQADQALLAALFNFADPVPELPPEPATRARRRTADGGPAAAAAEDEEILDGDYVVRFDGSSPSRKLTSAEINETVFANLGAVRPCLENEMRRSPRFRGATVSWSIQPDGRTFGVSVSSSGGISDENETCLTRAFRRMRFPTFNDVPMSVSFPFNVQ